MQSMSAPKRRWATGPATLGSFILVSRCGTRPREEWKAVLADLTEVVVADVHGAPGALGIEKAVSIVQSRTYLEKRAVQLLAPFPKDDGDWQLVKLDFGVEAQRHECEFLMRFVRAANGDPGAHPYVEIGFALPAGAGKDPIFVLKVRAAVGFARTTR